MKSYKSFRYKFTILIWILISLVLAIALAGAGFNVYNIVSHSKLNDSSGIAVSAIILAINILLAIFAISVMVVSKYIVAKNNVYCFFGLIPTKLKIEEITELTHFKASDTLVAYFKDDKYTVIVIAPEKYDDFVEAVREINNKIVFDLQTEENKT